MTSGVWLSRGPDRKGRTAPPPPPPGNISEPHKHSDTQVRATGPLPSGSHLCTLPEYQGLQAVMHTFQGKTHVEGSARDLQTTETKEANPQVAHPLGSQAHTQ